VTSSVADLSLQTEFFYPCDPFANHHARFLGHTPLSFHPCILLLKRDLEKEVRSSAQGVQETKQANNVCFKKVFIFRFCFPSHQAETMMADTF